MTNDTIALIANIALTLTFVVGLIFGIAQVMAAARDRRERLTLETIRNFQSHEFAELINMVTNRPTPTTRDEFRALPEADQIMFIQFGQTMEHLGILVADKLIDLDLIDKTLGSFVTSTWERYKPMFLDMREQFPDPFLAEYYQWLAECIDQRMRENPRPPVYETAGSKKGTGKSAL